MHHLISILLTLLLLAGGNSVVAKNQVSSASLGDLCALAVNSSSTRTTTGPVFQIIPSQTQAFTVNDRLTTDTYDANGNTTESRSVGVSPTSSSDIYSFDNKLIRRTTPDGKTIDLTYNPDGHRLSKFITQNALTQRLVHYLTDPNNPTGYAQVIEEKHPLEAAGSQLKKVHLYGHDLISSEEGGTGVSPVSSIFYNYDGLGSVRSISNSTGDLIETYDYDAYGTLIGLAKRNTTGVLESLNTENFNLATSSYLFTGEEFDSDLHMYFLRARYLNTNTGRFHTQDTYEGSSVEPLTLHKYLYANGNPASYTDPSGNFGLVELSVAQNGSDTIDRTTSQATANVFKRNVANKRWEIFRIEISYFEHTFIWANDIRSKSALGYHVVADKRLMGRSRKLGIFVPSLFIVIPQPSASYFGPAVSQIFSGFLTQNQFLVWNAVNVPLGFSYALEGLFATPFDYRITDSSCKTWTNAAAASAAAISLLPF